MTGYSLTLQDVRNQAARVQHFVDGIEFRWNVSFAWESESGVAPRRVGYFIQIEYDEADIDDPDGPKLVQRGRKWFIGADVNVSEVLQTMLKAALASAEHRTREWFLVDGERIYGPHMNANHLVSLLKRGVPAAPGYDGRPADG